MSILDNAKEIASVIQEINNPDLYMRVLVGKSSWRCPACKRQYMTGGERYPSLGRSGPIDGVNLKGRVQHVLSLSQRERVSAC